MLTDAQKAVLKKAMAEEFGDRNASTDVVAYDKMLFFRAIFPGAVGLLSQQVPNKAAAIKEMTEALYRLPGMGANPGGDDVQQALGRLADRMLGIRKEVDKAVMTWANAIENISDVAIDDRIESEQLRRQRGW